MGRIKCKFVQILFILYVTSLEIRATKYRYECVQGKCVKFRITNETLNTAVSLSSCQVLCSKYGSIWPKPTGQIQILPSLRTINVSDIDVVINSGKNDPINELVNGSGERFKHNVRLCGPKNYKNTNEKAKALRVVMTVTNTKQLKVLFKQNEDYELNVVYSSYGNVLATIKAENFFGARHGLETLSQLIIFDDIRNEFQILDNVHIIDSPVYQYRGLLLDTARNFIKVDTIKRTIEGMAASKLNVFHWHITDSHSFPYVSKSVPYLSDLGAYAPNKIYTRDDIAEIIEYARIRGVKVMPEFDSPAHVGEGWQDTNLLTCFNAEPWDIYCMEPPCGQLDPTQDGVYDVLELIYKDMIEQFDPDIFHMGGDEVNHECWYTSERIRNWVTSNNYNLTNNTAFLELWNKFQSEARNRFIKQRGKHVPVILWTSTLTNGYYIDKYISKKDYIIQVWSATTNTGQLELLLNKDYQVIMSNYDALYLDCGFESWMSHGNSWCSPYIGWQRIYSNSPAALAGKKKHLVLGGEAALWTEQVSDGTVDSRFWPRGAALAERLWSEPVSTWKDAKDRFIIHRERLARFNIMAESVVPEWCLQHQGICVRDDDD